MSFFGKFKPGSATASQAAKEPAAKKDPNAPQPTPLEKHLHDVTGPVRADGSDKFFGFENYGSTCYCNSIIQCLYYSAPFREHVLNFPSKAFLDRLAEQTAANGQANGAPVRPESVSTTPYPNPTSPARKQALPTSPGATAKPEDSKDSPEYRKRMALAAGPVLEMTKDYSQRYGMDESLFTSLKDIFEAILNHQSRIGVVSPHKFLEILRRENEMFRSAMHQDAHEFLNLLLNQVVDNVELFSRQHPNLSVQPQANGNAPEEKESSAVAEAHPTNGNGLDTHWVHDLFEGLLTSETRCLTCENTSHRDEAFLDLSVDLSPHTSVTSCLRKFSEEEMLCERNKFHCDNCGGLQEAEKRMKIKRLPRILALHLKRFKYTEDLQRLQKLFHRVVYPFHLRLFNTTDDAEDPDRLYELYAVVVHIGGGPYHGHYVSIIKTQDRGWLLFDDELVEPVSRDYVLNFFGGEPIPGLQDARQLACAYVLFYQETTLEAMLKEQETEGGLHQVPTRVSDAETAKDNFSPTKADFRQVQTVTTPIHEEVEHMDTLVHAMTAPELAPPPPSEPAPAVRPPFPHLPSTPIIPALKPPKSRKEMKAEAKAKKAEKKEQELAEAQKRKERSQQRIDAWRKQDEELKRVLEESRQTAREEAAQRGEKPPPPEKTSNGGGLARFRQGSMSLRVKPKLFGKDKSDANGEKTSGLGSLRGQPSPAMGSEAALQEEEHYDEKNGTTTATAPAQTRPRPPPDPVTEERKLSNRFSLGRKKSQPMT